MTIDTYAEHQDDQTANRIREIFFLSADPRNVSTDEGRNDAFYKKWAGYYLEHRPEWILLACEDGQILAYLMCEPDSRRAQDHYRTANPSYEVFADQFEAFPAHLHMNTHPLARGRGLGAQLIEELVRRLKAENVPGVHLVTSATQRNAGFYRRNGFTSEVTRSWRGHPLLFMGRKI